MTTKERILDEALTLFSKNGYDAVSVGEIADAVGIKAPSLYKHFESKQAIFDALLYSMDAHYKQVVSSLNMNGENSLIDSVFFEKITAEQLLKIATSLFTYFLHDSLTQRFRKLLTTCQYDNPKLAQLFTSQYVTAPLAYQTQLFSLLTQKNDVHCIDPSIMALQFFSPIYYLLVLCDREPEKEDWALQMLKEHILQFNKIYGKKINKGE